MDKVLIVTATEVEAEAVLELFPQPHGNNREPCFIGRKTYCALGEVGGVELYMVQSEMGSGTPGGSFSTVSEAIKDLAPVAVIMVGICFGVKSKEREIGHILVSHQLRSYESQKKGEKQTILRGDKSTASEDLLDKFRAGKKLGWTGARVHFGLMLSGEKLVNDPEFLQELLELEPEAIGGEMEGAGLYAAARYASVPWIIVKAICDWADGKKKDKHQRLAAANAAAFTLHVIQQGGMKHLPRSGIQTGSVSQLARVGNEEQRSAVRSTIPGRYGKPFVGRDDELGKMAVFLKDTSSEEVLVLHGPSGAGKSELGFEFARTYQSRYPGGTFLVRAGSTGVAIDLAGIGKNILGLQFPADLKLEEQGLETFHKLGSAPTLLVYDGVMSPDEIRDWLPSWGKACHVIITTVVDRWNPNWPIVHVDPLSNEETLDLVRAIGGDGISDKYGRQLGEHCQGLPIQIVPMAETLRLAFQRGLDESVEFTLSKEGTASFAGVYDCLEPDQKLLLHAAAHLNPQRILRDHLFRHLTEPGVMDERQVIDSLNACMDLTLLQGSDELRMHQLMADFVRSIALEKKLTKKFKKVRQAQAKHLVELAEKFGDSPADANLAAELTALPLSADAWLDIQEHFSSYQEHQIGYALHELGLWATAIPWLREAVGAYEKDDARGRVDHESLGRSLAGIGYCYGELGNREEGLQWYQRAVAEQEKGDTHGRADHTELGKSLHQVGICYSGLDKYEEALPWYERAVKEKEIGDIHARIDHQSLGKSLHSVGVCYSKLGKNEEALPWFERAVKEQEQGDIHGRVDHASLGKSLNMTGFCYGNLGRFEEALPWHERAVHAKEQGDIHGRVDHESVGKSIDSVGWCYSSLGKFEEALPWFKRAVEEAEKGDIHGGVDHDSLGTSFHQVGSCYFELGQFEKALPWYDRAVKAKGKGDIYGRVDEESLQFSRDALTACQKKLGRF